MALVHGRCNGCPRQGALTRVGRFFLCGACVALMQTRARFGQVRKLAINETIDFDESDENFGPWEWSKMHRDMVDK